MLDYYTEDIMWCENRECDVTDCFRNPKHIRPFTFRPLSFASLENTEFCKKQGELKNDTTGSNRDFRS